MIIAAGLSPAWQQILVFDRLTRGQVNRAIETTACASGKVINVARALSSLRADAKVVTVLGGRTGEMVIEELTHVGVTGRYAMDSATTRTCTTIIERSTGEITELVENAPSIGTASYEEFFRFLHAEANRSNWLIFSGSLPLISGRNSNRSIYRELFDTLIEGQKIESTSPHVILDARGPEMLECLPLRPYLVKPNREELAMTVGRALDDDDLLITAMREINQRGAQWVLVTQGNRPAWLSSNSELWTFTPPKIEVVNPIGCGDCLTAGLAAALDRGDDLPSAVCWGIACAGDNARQLLPARLDPARVAELAHQVVVERG